MYVFFLTGLFLGDAGAEARFDNSAPDLSSTQTTVSTFLPDVFTDFFFLFFLATWPDFLLVDCAGAGADAGGAGAGADAGAGAGAGAGADAGAGAGAGAFLVFFFLLAFLVFFLASLVSVTLVVNVTVSFGSHT